MQLGPKVSSFIKVVVVVLKLIDLGALGNDDKGSTPESNNQSCGRVDRLIATVKQCPLRLGTGKCLGAGRVVLQMDPSRLLAMDLGLLLNLMCGESNKVSEHQRHDSRGIVDDDDVLDCKRPCMCAGEFH